LVYPLVEKLKRLKRAMTADPGLGPFDPARELPIWKNSISSM
jgi:hypothetical protein